MSAPPQLEIKFLNVFGDTYHMPGGSFLLTADRKLGIPGYDDFLDKYGFKGTVTYQGKPHKPTPGTNLPFGVATEEEAEIITYFGAPYIYGPALATQTPTCRPGEYAKIVPFLKHRLTTLDAQINNAVSVSTGGVNLPKQRFENIKSKLANYISEMDSTKVLPKCEDYKIDYFKDDTEMMNYLTRALYYGLKPEAGTDEHVKCVNLFRDAKGGDAELQALLQIVKDKRADGMLSFMEIVGSSLAGLVHKINEDRSFASTVAGATGAAGPGPLIPGIDPKIVQDLKNQLADYFNSLDSTAKIGEPLRTANAVDLVKTFTDVVSKAGPLLAKKSAGPGPGGFPASLDDLSAQIIKQLDALGVKGATKPGKFYNSDYAKVLQDILVMLEKGPVTAAGIGAAIDKLALVKAFEGFDIMKILKYYLAMDKGVLFNIIENNISKVGGTMQMLKDEDKETIKLYQTLFAICNSKDLNKFSKITSDATHKANMESNMKLNLNNKVKYNGEEYTIKSFVYYKSQYITYGLFELVVDGMASNIPVYAGFNEKLETTTTSAFATRPAYNFENIEKYLGDKGFNPFKPTALEIGTSTNEGIVREQFIYCKPTGVPPVTRPYYVVNNKGVFNLVNGDGKASLGSTTAGKPEDGEIQIDMGSASSTGGGGADPAEVARLKAELDASKITILMLEGNQKKLQGDLDALRGKVVGDPAALKAIQEQVEAERDRNDKLQKALNEALMEGANLERQLEEAQEQLKLGADEALKTKVKELEEQLAETVKRAKEAIEIYELRIKDMQAEIDKMKAVTEELKKKKTEQEELTKKQTAGTITPEETERLTSLNTELSADEQNKRIISLETHIAGLDSFIKNLQILRVQDFSKIKGLETAMAELQAQLEASEKAITEGEQALETLSQEMAAAVEAEKKKCESLTAKLAEAEAKIAAAGGASKAEVDALTAERDTLRTQLETAQTELGTLRPLASSKPITKQVADALAEKQAALKQVEELRKQLAAAIVRQGEIEAELAAERAKKPAGGAAGAGTREAELEAQLATAKAAAAAAAHKAEQEIKKLTTELNIFITGEEDLRKKIATLEAIPEGSRKDEEKEELKKLKESDTLTLQARIATLEEACKKLQTENKELEPLRNALAEAQRVIQSGKDQLAAAQEAVAKTLAEQKAKCAALQKLLDESTSAAGASDPAEIKRQLDEAAASVKKANDATAASQAALDAARRSIAEKDEAIAAATAAADKAKADFFTSGSKEADLIAAQEEVAKLTKQRDDAIRQLEEANKAHAAAMASQIAAHAIELAAAGAAAAAKPPSDAEKAEAQRRIDELTQQLASAQAEATALRASSKGGALTDTERSALQEQIDGKSAEIGNILIALSLTAAKSGSNVDAVKAKLKQTSDGFQSQIGTLRTELANTEGDLAKARKSYGDAQVTIRTKETEITGLRAQLKPLEEAQAAAAGKVPGLESQIAKLTADLNAALAAAKQPDIAAAHAQLAQLQAQARTIKENMAELTAYRGLINSQIEELEKEYGKIGKKIGWQQALDRLAQKARAAEELMKIAQGKATEEERRAFSESHKAFGAFLEADQAKRERDEAVGKVAGLESQISSLQSMKATSDETYSRMRDELYTTSSALGAAQVELARVNAALKAFQAEKPQASQVNPMYASADKISLLGKEARIKQLTSQLADLQKVKAELEAKLAARSGDVDIQKLLEIIREYIKTCKAGGDETSTEELEDALRRMEGLASQLTEKDAEIEALHTELSAREKALNGFVTSQAELQGQLAAITEEKSSSQTQLQEQLAQVQEQLTAAKQEKAEAQAQFEARAKDMEGQLATALDKLKATELITTGLTDKLTKLTANYQSIASKLGLTGDNVPVQDILSAINSFEEKRKNAVAALEGTVKRLETENEELGIQVEESQAEIASLKRQIKEMRTQSSVQTFGALSGMLSSPAFKAATIGIFTKFAGDQKRKTKQGYEGASNSNIRETIPEEAPAGLEPLKAYYINLLAKLSEQLQADQTPIQINDPEQINILANILKIISSPQPAGIYSLNDLVFNSPKAQSLMKQLNAINEETFNSSEPVLFIPTPESREILKQGKIKVSGDIDLNQQMKTQLIQNFFSVNDKAAYIMYPAIKIGEYLKEEKDISGFVENIDINLFEINNNTVRFGRYIVDKKPTVQANARTNKKLPTLGSFLYQDSVNKKFFAPGVGKLISRAEIIRIFIKSLLSTLRTAW